MKFGIVFCLVLVCLQLQAQQYILYSPNGNLKCSLQIDNAGALSYTLQSGNTELIKNSQLGFNLKNAKPLKSDFVFVFTDTSVTDETWNTVWGESKTIRNNYHRRILTVQQKTTGIILQIECKIFNDGLGFRYLFPQQDNLKYFIISDELTEFHVNGNHNAFWLPGDFDTNEYAYTQSRLSDVHAIESAQKYPEIATRNPIGDNIVQTPLLLKSDDGWYMSIHEAALVNYAAMELIVDKQNFILTTTLAPDALGNLCYLSAPCSTPWRTIIVSKKATDILASRIILNLNAPCVIENTTWIKPMKFIGIWWGMHVDKYTWNYSNSKNINIETTDWTSLKPNGKHGATTENAMEYIDFAASNGFDGVLIEGWNVGWEDWFGNWKENVFDFVTPYPDFDVDAVQAYAEKRHVQIIMHHETSGSVTNYERRLPAAIDFMKAHNYHAVKTGYVGKIIPRGEYHDGQWMVNHYIYVAEMFAKNEIMLDAHEPVRPTGLSRTYPNWLACEAARGNEFNAWSKGNPPEHETILPFTRLLGGPMDYTPGIFQIKMDYYDAKKTTQVHTTLAKQLALYVTMYSPFQMAADLPENYRAHPDAFQFIKDVPVDWDETKYISAEPGDYIAIARKEKNGNNWYLGAITDENARTLNLSLDFLDSGKDYIITIYCDGETADWKNNPMDYRIEKYRVNSKTILSQTLAPGGGAAMEITLAKSDELQGLKLYKNKGK